VNALQNPLVVLAILAWLAAPSHSLGEAAKKEALRRQITPRSRATLTNLGQPAELPVVATPPLPLELPATIPAPAAAKPSASAADHKNDEPWWRARVTDARKALDRDLMLTDALQSRINALQRDVVNRDDPAQQAKLRQELQRTLAEWENAKKQISNDYAVIKDIQDEARRLDVPAGWVR
jgi:hypothetical protein